MRMRNREPEARRESFGIADIAHRRGHHHRPGRSPFVSLSRAVLAGSVAAGAALTAACPGGTDSDGASDSDSQ